jgi:hypothetical protein
MPISRASRWRHQSASSRGLWLRSWPARPPCESATAWKPLRGPPTSMPTTARPLLGVVTGSAFSAGSLSKCGQPFSHVVRLGVLTSAYSRGSHGPAVLPRLPLCSDPIHLRGRRDPRCSRGAPRLMAASPKEESSIAEVDLGRSCAPGPGADCRLSGCGNTGCYRFSSVWGTTKRRAPGFAALVQLPVCSPITTALPKSLDLASLSTQEPVEDNGWPNAQVRLSFGFGPELERPGGRWSWGLWRGRAAAGARQLPRRYAALARQRPQRRDAVRSRP